MIVSRVRLTSEISREAYQRKFLDQLLKGISWDICFKLLSSSPKPLFLWFYIKTQVNSTILHFINISKVIFNSFNWFWSLDYVFGSFMFIVEIFSNGSHTLPCKCLAHALVMHLTCTLDAPCYTHSNTWHVLYSLILVKSFKDLLAHITCSCIYVMPRSISCSIILSISCSLCFVPIF